MNTHPAPQPEPPDRAAAAPAPASPRPAATEWLLARILDGTFAPGDRLPPERELAAQLGTNRNTLREAIRELDARGLVRARRGSGVTVRDYQRHGRIDLLAPFLLHAPDESVKARVLGDLLPARTAVLEMIVRVAAERRPAGALARLRAAGEAAIAADERAAATEAARAYDDWLHALVDATDSIPVRWIANPILEAQTALLERMPELWLTGPGFAEHIRGVQRGLQAGDGAAAAAALKAWFGQVDALLTSDGDCDEPR
jgi:DNA-binding FadR family transcriptional regulator